MGFLPWETRMTFPGESQLRQSRATQPTVHAGRFSVSIIHRTLTWTTGSLTCAQMSCMRLHTGCTDTVRESALKVDSKSPCRAGESNLLQRRAGPTLYQLSYIPILTTYLPVRPSLPSSHDYCFNTIAASTTPPPHFHVKAPINCQTQ